ncbi:hypothetical protein [Leucobacter sp. GX0328]
MPKSNDDARLELQEILKKEERDASWIARRIGKSYQWVQRRLRGVTPMQIDDYNLILSAFEREQV